MTTTKMSKKVVSVEYGDSKSLFNEDFRSQHRIAVRCSNAKCDDLEVSETRFARVCITN